jgi:hypothetical protein
VLVCSEIKVLWLVAGDWFVLREKYCWLVDDKPSERDPQVLEKLSYCQNVVLAGGSYNNVLKPASAKNAGWPLPSPSPKRRRRQPRKKRHRSRSRKPQGI